MKDKNKIWTSATFLTIWLTFLMLILYFFKVVNINIVMIFLGLTQIVSGLNQLRGNKARMSTTNMIFSGMAVLIGFIIIIISVILI